MSSTLDTRSPVPPTTTGRRRRGTRRALSQRSAAAWMIAPAGVLMVTFVLVPIALTFALAFTNSKLVSPEPIAFIGFDNFTRIFADATFWKSLRNTVVFAVFVVPFQAGFALGLALLINVKIKGVNFFRTIYFLPVVTSMVVVAILWTFIYQPNGLINSLLLKIGIHGPDWLGNSHTALAAIIFMSIWQNVGFHMVIWLSGLQTIPSSLYEASSLDGASTWQNFKWVTWPGLKQTRTFILITITIAALALFTQINIMTQGGPLDSTSTVVYQAVRAGFQQQQTGYASAISLVFFVIVLMISLVQRFLTRDKDAVR
ncbi:carbohydrate ABC transporter permease [Nakamurella sp. PAMC28650]|uniref:carbohydrate ABC transporter permease n=1 Tax=Nakamurella sp. PAMC28650 TaxID=2762325 RepID=UPI00164D6B2E|nr:sugar ABC transporter permease [Nakamurella sp. PAMC28650]QNK80775.1 sugar ABC transporter permease [Nakamurella sp. PAMC28650]